MKLRDTTIDDCGFIESLFDNADYEQYFAENDTAEEWKAGYNIELHR